MFRLDQFDLDEFVNRVLKEDLGEGGDVTSIATIPENATFSAEMVSREPIVLAGLPVAEAFFRRLDQGVRIETFAVDGDACEAGQVLMRLKGNARAMLTAERSALNTLQHLSGISTHARRFAEAVEGTGATVLDTRKTMPGMRALNKYAAKMGGVSNHRMRLDDGVLIKDNHIGVAGSVEAAVKEAVAADTGLQIQVEVDRIDQIEPALAAGAERLLLDNMPPEVLKEAVALVDGRVPLEASGGVNLDTIRAIAETGVDYISTSKVTMGAPAVDIGLDYVLEKDG